jgi:cell division protein FtsB
VALVGEVTMTDQQPEWLDHDTPPTKKKRKTLRALLAAVLATVVIAGGYFGYEAYQEQQRQEAVAAAKAEKKAKAEAAAAKLAKEQKACERGLDDYLDALEDIDSRLDVGLTQDTLADMAGDASSEENDVDEDELPEWCLDAKAYADDALDDYASTAMDWNECIWDDWCDPDYDIDLQGPWQDASYALEKAVDVIENGGDGEDT